MPCVAVRKIIKDTRTIEQKIAAVEASMNMGGYYLTDEDQQNGYRILQGEISSDQVSLNYLEKHGYGHTEAARLICESIANKAASSKSS